MSLTMSPLAPNCEWMVTPGFCCLKACSSAVNGVARVPAPNTVSVPVAPAALLALLAGLLLVVLVLLLLLVVLLQAAARARTSPAAAASPQRRNPRLIAALLRLKYYRSVQSLTAPRTDGSKTRPHCNPRR